MSLFPIKKCKLCGEAFELRPGKPGLATHCPACTEERAQAAAKDSGMSAQEKRAMDAERREAMRNLLYRKDS